MKYLLLLLLASYNSICIGQSNAVSDETPRMSLLAPEASSLGRYEITPVSEYTGVPSIEIPLWICHDGDIAFPLTLAYHASGIKVAQESTWVGLGWDLVGVGCINRILSGSHDNNNVNSSIAEWQQFFSNYSDATAEPNDVCQWGEKVSDSEQAYKLKIYNDLLWGMGEPDLFQCIFCGHSLVFYIDPFTKIPQTVGEDKNEYKIIKIGNTLYHGWRIIAPDGVKYDFETRGTDMTSTREVSTWYLTQIIHPERGSLSIQYTDGNTHLSSVSTLSQYNRTFNYIKTLDSYMPNKSGEPSPELFGIKDSYDYLNSYIRHRYPISISTSLEDVRFFTSNRNDLDGGLKLDSITVSEKISGEVVCRLNFYYSYFEGSKIGGDYLSVLNPNVDAKRLRLKLDSVVVNGENYSFGYNKTPLPYKTSYSVDFWGYFNGMNNSNLLCPADYRELCQRKSLRGQFGSKFSNRYANPSVIQAGILNKIVYPTKGYAIFNYEPNTFVDDSIWCPTANVIANSEVLVNHFAKAPKDNVNSTDKYFTLEEETQVHIIFSVTGPSSQWNKIEENARGRLVGFSGNNGFSSKSYQPLPLNGNTTMVQTQYFDITLPAGGYGILCDFPTGIEGYAAMTLTYSKQIESEYDSISYGGGVRIASIEQHEEDGALLRKRMFKYEESNGTSSGRLLCPLPFIQTDSALFASVSELHGPSNEKSYHYCLDLYREFSISSSVRMPAITSLFSTPVAYSKVRVEDVTTSQLNEWTETRFINDKIRHYFYDVYLMPHYNNGKILQKDIYAADGKLKRRIDYSYKTISYNEEMVNAIIKDRTPGIPDVDLWHYIHQIKRYRIQCYPFITELSVPDEVRTSDIFYGNNVADTLCKTVVYDYDSYNHQPSRISEIIGNGTWKSVELKYANNYPYSGYYRALTDSNYINLPLGKTYRVNDHVVRRTQLTMRQNAGHFVKDVFSTATGTSDYLPQITYDNYDDYGNVLQITQPDSVKVSYIWSYCHQYPVAEITGMTYAQLQSQLKSDLLYSISNNLLNENNIGNIKSRLSNALVKLMLYKPLRGMSLQISPNGNIEHYDYDSFGRLKTVKNSDNQTIMKYDYHYK